MKESSYRYKKNNKTKRKQQKNTQKLSLPSFEKMYSKV